MSISDITGTPGASASFDATGLGYPTSSYNFQWTWTSIQSGSLLQNDSVPMPDNAATGSYFNMADNELLVHFEGNVDDTSGNGRNGTTSGGSFSSGRVGGNAYSMATADYVSFGGNLRYTTQDFSFALWVKPGSTQNSYAAVFSCYNAAQTGYYFQQDAGNTNQYSLIGNNGTSWHPVGVTMGLTANVWHHVVLVRQGSAVTAYLNGVREYYNSNAVASNIQYLTSNPDFVIGGTTGVGTWNGEVDEFASWTRALTALEVNNLFFQQSGSCATDQVGNVGIGDTFTFVPDIAGIYVTSLNVTGTAATSSFTGGATASIGIQNVSPINLFSSVVHDSSPATANAINLYTSVVHDATPATANAINLFSSVVHDTLQISGTLADITGTVNVSASFDGSVLGFSTSSVNFQWTWQSVPSGSSITNQAYPLPDNNANTYFNMASNVGLWHFEGNADDTSGNNNNGAVNGASLVAGRVGNEAYSFDGSNDFIEVPHDPSLTVGSEVSISLWVYLNSIGPYEGMVCKGINQGQYWIGLDSGGGGEFSFGTYYWTNKVTSNTALSTGRWYHIAAVYDNGDVSLYLDGQLDKQQSVGWSLTANTEALTFGVDKPGSDEYLDGVLDEIAIWSRPLSSLEVNNLYFLQSGSLATDLVGNIGLGETFTFVPDVSGTFTTNLTITDGASSLSGNANAVISAAPSPAPGPITGSNPTVKLVESEELGYVFNTYKIDLLSVQRSRISEQVPFKLGTKGKQSLRTATNTEFTGSS